MQKIQEAREKQQEIQKLLETNLQTLESRCELLEMQNEHLRKEKEGLQQKMLTVQEPQPQHQHFMFQPSVKDLQNPNQNAQNSHRHNPSFDAINVAANSAQNVVFQSNTNLRQQASAEQMMCITSPTFQGLEQPASNSRREGMLHPSALGGHHHHDLIMPSEGLSLSEQISNE